jgi:hypothetical protein
MNRYRFAHLAALASSLLMGIGGTAMAYSAAAVKDAQSQFVTIDNRFKSGEVKAGDVALAKYNVLEMKHKAGELSRAAFCKAAKHELKVVADEFKEPEGQAGSKAKWQAEVVAMAASPAACEKAETAADTLMFGVTPRPTSEEAVQEAERAAKVMAARYDAGTAARSDVSQAKYSVLDAKYGAKQIVLKDYCDGALPLVQSIADDIDKQAKIGQSGLWDVMGAHRTLYRVEAECKK